MSFTDYLRLSEHKIFKEACEVLPKFVDKPLNLLAMWDSVLFTWDFANNCVLSLNVKAARSKNGDNVIHQYVAHQLLLTLLRNLKSLGVSPSLGITYLSEQKCLIKRPRDQDQVFLLGQKLLPLHTPYFSPEFLFVNESGSLLAIAGPNGILVVQLPPRCPPYGTFDNNKELVYCKSYSLDERLLACSDVIHVRQAKFHPGSVSDSHVLVLTSDNMLRLYQIYKNEALSLGAYLIGEKPGGRFPGSKTTFLDIYGEIAVDFDFGFPQISDEKPARENLVVLMANFRRTPPTNKITPTTPLQKAKNEKSQFEELIWPVYILRGDFSVYSLNIDLNRRIEPVLKGPCVLSGQPDFIENDACAILCLETTPQIVCIASTTGTLTHSILLNVDQEQKEKLKRDSNSSSTIPDKELLLFETVELELGLSIANETDDEESKKYKCPIFLRSDESKASRYFATHNAGVHTVNLNCVEELHNYVSEPDDANPTSDIFINPSSTEYLVCTKTSNNEKSNPVIGFTLYYEPTSIITLLSDASVVTLGILSTVIVPKNNNLTLEGEDQNVKSPLKKMLNEPFDQYIQKILKKGASRPLLKLSSTASITPEEYYDIFQRTTQTFREEQFKNITKAREELEKRVHTLNMLKEAQKAEIEKINACKDQLRDTAENLAEKYEDIKDIQDELLKRCEQLVILVSRKKADPSDAEKKFMQDLQAYSRRSVAYQNAIDKLKNKSKYQEVQIENWKALESSKVTAISELQSITIKSSIQESTQKINEMVKNVNEYMALLNLK